MSLFIRVVALHVLLRETVVTGTVSAELIFGEKRPQLPIPYARCFFHSTPVVSVAIVRASTQRLFFRTGTHRMWWVTAIAVLALHEGCLVRWYRSVQGPIASWRWTKCKKDASTKKYRNLETCCKELGWVHDTGGVEMNCSLREPKTEEANQGILFVGTHVPELAVDLTSFAGSSSAAKLSAGEQSLDLYNQCGQLVTTHFLCFLTWLVSITLNYLSITYS